MPDLDVVLIVSGAPLTARTPELVEALIADGWSPQVIGTPGSTPWLDGAALERLTGEAPRLDFRSPGQAKRGGAPLAVVVCPATFNTVNKAAVGINDSYAAGVLCEAIGTDIPTLMVPMVNNKLWGHFAWPRNLRALSEAGVVMLDVHSGQVGATAVRSGTGDEVVRRFDPGWVTARLKAVRETTGR